MKLRYFTMAAGLGAILCSGLVLPQSANMGGPPLPSPQTSTNRLSGNTGIPLIDSPSSAVPPESGVPSRRVPSPTTPDLNDSRPVTPDIWQKGRPASDTASPAPETEMKKRTSSLDEEAIKGAKDTQIKADLQGLNDGTKNTGIQRLSPGGAGDQIQRLNDTAPK